MGNTGRVPQGPGPSLQLQRSLSCWAQFSAPSPMAQGFQVAGGWLRGLPVALPHSLQPLVLLEERICPRGKPPRCAEVTPRGKDPGGGRAAPSGAQRVGRVGRAQWWQEPFCKNSLQTNEGRSLERRVRCGHIRVNLGRYSVPSYNPAFLRPARLLEFPLGCQLRGGAMSLLPSPCWASPALGTQEVLGSRLVTPIVIKAPEGPSGAFMLPRPRSPPLDHVREHQLASKAPGPASPSHRSKASQRHASRGS